MANNTLKFEDFEAEILTKNEQKVVRGGGDGDTDPPNEPGRTGKGGNGDEALALRISITISI